MGLSPIKPTIGAATRTAPPYGDLIQELHPVSGSAVCVDSDQRSEIRHPKNPNSNVNRD
jgi:hypothetical protein